MLNRVLNLVLTASSDKPMCTGQGLGQGLGRGRNRRDRGKFSGPLNTIISFAVTAAVHDVMKKDSVIKKLCSRAVGYITGNPVSKSNLLDNHVTDDSTVIEVEALPLEDDKRY